jgi:hypothetical protein
MSTIPEIRARMHELADEHGIPELHDLAEETRRRSPLRRAKPRWPRLTDEVKQQVREMFAARPELGVRELADHFRTSIGRISEAVRGFRS